VLALPVELGPVSLRFTLFNVPKSDLSRSSKSCALTVRRGTCYGATTAAITWPYGRSTGCLDRENDWFGTVRSLVQIHSPRFLRP